MHVVGGTYSILKYQWTIPMFTLKGREVSMYDQIIHNLYKPHRVHKYYPTYLWTWNHVHTLSYVKENIQIYLYLTLMINTMYVFERIQGHWGYVLNLNLH